MSTGYVKSYTQRFALLARLNEQIFHTKDLANLWAIQDKNTLYTTLKRYTQHGLIFRIFKGLYAMKPITQLQPWLLGLRALHTSAYISTETILEQAGIIQQKMHSITLISSLSKRFTLGPYHYRSRKLADKFLYNTAGIAEKDGMRLASPERAIADMLYFHPKIYFDGNRHIDWQQVKKIQDAVGYPLTPKRYL
ncbi:MAG: hypothetical protein A3F54_02615 [Candidatus Kerfeldbacteria bacterium RIFCSPHIGHO2_12_FULL_48_17]|uniref:AbiEi antitoxin C-terminal domain-containing protein n=1 Tax=Candidatus Kerfeldbacteria bacterium RIFCSPHIGHO2_12_FULL_48_17 TaxID=1798542 RepID=A0A1G2AX19_9BACT|nr:MAG: hypothetical protein A3F54_02615 [Candidatus Kerfeldbacteria bacterium RIFCSPHIGHO2_12_FULL_48_17]